MQFSKTDKWLPSQENPIVRTVDQLSLVSAWIPGAIISAIHQRYEVPKLPSVTEICNDGYELATNISSTPGYY